MLENIKLFRIFPQESPHSFDGSITDVLLVTHIRNDIIEGLNNNFGLIQI